MMKKRYRKCCKCGKLATWTYMPSGNGQRWYCDDCVNRGCTCNLRDLSFDGEPKTTNNLIWWSKEVYDKAWETDEDIKIEDLGTKERMPDSFYYERLDEKGRRSPCCEYWYDEEGDDFEETQYYITKAMILSVLDKSKYKLSISASLVSAINEFISKLKDKGNYNTFMSRFYNVCSPYFKIGYSAKINRKFYLSVRDKLRELRIKQPYSWEIDEK